MSKNKNILKSLSLYPLQAYLTDKVQLFNIVEEVLNQTGPATLMITSFSISEEFIRSMYKMKQKGLVINSGLIIDTRATVKIARIMPFACNVFDQIYLSNNHSKVLLIRNDSFNVSVCTSQNQTRGNRNESGMITTDKIIYTQYEESINEIIKNGIDARNILGRAIK